jgi:hypothetical protein
VTSVAASSVLAAAHPRGNWCHPTQGEVEPLSAGQTVSASTELIVRGLDESISGGPIPFGYAAPQAFLLDCERALSHDSLVRHPAFNLRGIKCQNGRFATGPVSSA